MPNTLTALLYAINVFGEVKQSNYLMFQDEWLYQMSCILGNYPTRQRRRDANKLRLPSGLFRKVVKYVMGRTILKIRK